MKLLGRTPTDLDATSKAELGERLAAAELLLDQIAELAGMTLAQPRQIERAELVATCGSVFAQARELKTENMHLRALLKGIL